MKSALSQFWDKHESSIEVRDMNLDHCPFQSPPDRLRRAAIRLYSIMHIVSSAARLVQLARYLTGNSASHAPELASLGLCLKDAPPRPDDDHSWTHLGTTLRSGQIGLVHDWTECVDITGYIGSIDKGFITCTMIPPVRPLSSWRYTIPRRERSRVVSKARPLWKWQLLCV